MAVVVNSSGTRPLGQRGVKRPAVLAWLRLTRAFQKVERAGNEQMRDYGLSMAQFEVLAHVGAVEGLTQTDLADSLLVTKGNICQLLDRMECAGLLARRQEGRVNRLFLTDKGRTLFQEVVPLHEELIVQKLGVLDSEEQSQLLTLLRKLDHALE